MKLALFLSLVFAMPLSSSAAEFVATSAPPLPSAYNPAATLPDGTALVLGRNRHGQIFDPKTGSFRTTAGFAHVLHTGGHAIALSSGQILIAGDFYSDYVDIYDPGTDQFNSFRGLEPRRQAGVALLKDGRALIVGGETQTAELFDPITGKFTRTGNPVVWQMWPIAVSLGDGRVLIAGGSGSRQGDFTEAEVYDPATGQFTQVAPIPSGAYRSPVSQAIELADGRAFVLGHQEDPLLAVAYLFDPATNAFVRAAPLVELGRGAGGLTLLRDGKVLLAGGGGFKEDGSSTVLNTAELFDPATGRFTATTTMVEARYGINGALMGDGSVLLVGGFGLHGIGPNSVLLSAEIYRP